MKKKFVLKKKLIAMLLTGTMIFSVMLTGCGSTESDDTDTSSSSDETVSDASSDAIEKKVFRIGVECTYAPYNWTQETDELANGETAVEIANSPGSYTYGYDIALAQMICDELGWELEVYKSDWTSIFMGLEDKTYDCIMSAVCYTEERDEIYDFTSCYYERQIMAVVREDGEYADVSCLSDFDGMNPTVIAQLGTNFVDYKDQIPSAVSGTDYEAAAELFLAIQNQTADVLITERATAESALNSMTDLIMLDLDDDDDFVAPEGSPNTCCILFRGDDELCEIIQGAMDSLGWTNETEEGLQAMNDLMSEMIVLQPSNN